MKMVNKQNVKTNSNMAHLAQTESQIASGALSNALSVSNTLTPANSIEQNYADFYKAYLNYKQGVFTSTDSVNLTILINGCVPRDGIVVLQARALYSLIYNDFTTRFDDCPVNNNSKSEAQSVKHTDNTNERFFSLYPNPNTGYMTLDYNLNDNEDGLLTIYDISGRKISSYRLISGQNSLVINEPSIKNGIYYYNIIVNNEVIKTNRIVIIK